MHLPLGANGMARADCLPHGANVYILAHSTAGAALYKIHYNGSVYQCSEGWETPVELSFGESSETATITRDTTGRLWIGTDAETSIVVYYSDSTGREWSGPVTLREGVSTDDICAVTVLREGQTGVMWSDQVRTEFGLAVHEDGDDPEVWTPEYVRAEGKLADDHINIARASDGTIYAAVKTEYDTIGMPQLGVLKRTPEGKWSDLAPITVLSATVSGTRPVALLDEKQGYLHVFYTNTAVTPRKIMLKSSATDNLCFPQEGQCVLEDEAGLSNVTSTRQPITKESGILILSTQMTGHSIKYLQISAP